LHSTFLHFFFSVTTVTINTSISYYNHHQRYVCMRMYVCVYGYGPYLISMSTMAMSVADGTIDDHDNGSVNIYVSSCVCLSVCLCMLG
jgi:hypothetical protein